MSEIIVGNGHLGNCPRCGYAIARITRAVPDAPNGRGLTFTPFSHHPVIAQCVMDHVLINPTIVMRWDAPSPIYPQPGASSTAR